MKARVIDNWKSSAVAVLILALCGLALWLKLATWSEVAGFMALSGVMAWVKDTIFKVKGDEKTESNG